MSLPHHLSRRRQRKVCHDKEIPAWQFARRDDNRDFLRIHVRRSSFADTLGASPTGIVAISGSTRLVVVLYVRLRKKYSVAQLLFRLVLPLLT
jgi:hypothetical protein